MQNLRAQRSVPTFARMPYRKTLPLARAARTRSTRGQSLRDMLEFSCSSRRSLLDSAPVLDSAPMLEQYHGSPSTLGRTLGNFCVRSRENSSNARFAPGSNVRVGANDAVRMGSARQLSP
jgi:hypothetical protein